MFCRKKRNQKGWVLAKLKMSCVTWHFWGEVKIGLHGGVFVEHENSQLLARTKYAAICLLRNFSTA